MSKPTLVEVLVDQNNDELRFESTRLRDRIVKLEAALRDLLMAIQNTAGLLVGSMTNTQLDELMLGVKAAETALAAVTGRQGRKQ